MYVIARRSENSPTGVVYWRVGTNPAVEIDGEDYACVQVTCFLSETTHFNDPRWGAALARIIQWRDLRHPDRIAANPWRVYEITEAA